MAAVVLLVLGVAGAIARPRGVPAWVPPTVAAGIALIGAGRGSPFPTNLDLPRRKWEVLVHRSPKAP